MAKGFGARVLTPQQEKEVKIIKRSILKHFQCLKEPRTGRRQDHNLTAIVTILTSCSRTKERLAERVKKVEKGVEVKKQQNNGNHSYTSPDPSLYIARFDADLLSTR
jgi:hypothetical protein